MKRDICSKQVLDEMLDNGFPLATEANILKELIKPPNMLRDVVNSGFQLLSLSCGNNECLLSVSTFYP
jgi:hypothetical protein